MSRSLGAPLTVGAVLMTTTVLLVAAMLWLRARLPADPDLYNLLYAQTRPQRPEGTNGFLFIFPAFCLSLSILIPFNMYRSRHESEPRRLVALAVSLSIYAVFAIGTMMRFNAVRHFYGV
ncbi:hypothetical protein SAMN06297144_1812 [Sphingomonas guangdongensis]|uniref:DUF1648 domain-containing protein n=1 Tax=Sphingomonas guangdongensis TaxID=1141890 RepID=A0A285QYS5_9SPHN|nr:hypothetical protein [Sphingomonas guangdongensis]SOB86704.1 hypothetical protein SAMN06297144_1812 [Sphingomonas guangdongensis]